MVVSSMRPISPVCLTQISNFKLVMRFVSNATVNLVFPCFWFHWILLETVRYICCLPSLSRDSVARIFLVDAMYYFVNIKFRFHICIYFKLFIAPCRNDFFYFRFFFSILPISPLHHLLWLWFSIVWQKCETGKRIFSWQHSSLVSDKGLPFSIISICCTRP